MKRGTPSHPKTLELAAALDLPQWGAVGILESLWHFAAQYARRGDVGRRSDAAIAKGMDWREDPERLITALVKTGFLDPCHCHRLRVHDWPEHADQTVRRSEEVKRRGFLECYQAVELLRGAAFAAAGADASVQLASDEDETSQPTPTPEPTPTDPPLTPPDGGEAPPATGPHGRAGPEQDPTAAARGRVERRQRAQALRDDADAAERYWVKLGGHPGPEDRRRIRDVLRGGRPREQLLGSIAERVRDELVAAGRLAPGDSWPPPGLAPFDPRPDPAPARASPAELEAAAGAWQRASEALRPRLSSHAWSTWIRPCRGLYVLEGRIAVEVPGPQHLDWIGRNWSAELQWAAAEAGLEGVDLVMAPAPAIAG